MKNAEIPTLLSPFSTNKENDFESIGEKGVGLKFVIFQSNHFVLETSCDSEEVKSIAMIDNAKQWKLGCSDEILKMNLEISDNKTIGTKIIISDVENDELFGLTFDSMQFILRTKTAIGNVVNIFSNIENQKEKIKVELEMIDNNGKYNNVELSNKFWLPTEAYNQQTDMCNLDDFAEWLKEDRSDAEKRRYLKDKIIYKEGKFIHANNRVINYWACFVPARKIWNDISKKYNLISQDIIDDEEKMDSYYYTTFQPGIYTSVKGMPTGISIDIPNTGNAGYWSNIFIIFDDKQLKFDIGRKSINGNVKVIYKNYAKEIFKEFTKYIVKYVAGEPELNVNSIWERDNVIAEINALPKLESNITSFLKIPSDQEATVAAIFYELIGKNIITNFKPIISGYKNKYDLYAYWGDKHFVIIEFKSHLRNIIRDFDDELKLSNEIDYIVCWDVNDDDIKAFNNQGLTLQELTKSAFSNDIDRYIPISTHVLNIPSAKPVYIIDLKKVLKEIENG